MNTFIFTVKIDQAKSLVHTPFARWHMIARLVGVVLPAVERELSGWKGSLQVSPSPFLKKQALQSIKSKRFHCQGGAAYTLPGKTVNRELLSFIVAYQTISDYLDNLCDRLPQCSHQADSCREQAYRQLHKTLEHALAGEEYGKIKGEEKDYYRYYPHQDDGGYLQRLVRQCRQSLAGLANYKMVQDKVNYLAGLYCDLQSLKHLSLEHREQALQDWFRQHRQPFSQLYWHEFAAAAGSTLGIFALLAAIRGENFGTEDFSNLFQLYFPWICGLHIMLDYFIDQDEDRREGDLNFVFFYENKEHCLERMELFIRETLQRSEGVANPLFHRTIVSGLLALYLSDPKIKEQGLETAARRLLGATGERDTFTLFHTCRLLRRCGIL